MFGIKLADAYEEVVAKIACILNGLQNAIQSSIFG
jgi:hypothetical protein